MLNVDANLKLVLQEDSYLLQIEPTLLSQIDANFLAKLLG
jgi:hypothetical protein